MKLGFNVLFSDTDVVTTRDPLHLMIWKNMDYVFSINHICPDREQFKFHGCKRCLEVVVVVVVVVVVLKEFVLYIH